MEAQAQQTTATRQRPVRTIHSPRLEKVQHFHAAMVLVLMILGVIGAIGLTMLGQPVGLPEITVFLVSTFLVGIGSSVGYHRHFTHRSFTAPTPVRVVLAILGSMAMQGSLLFWVALHRRHHENSDQTGDPHSPYVYEDGETPVSMARGVWHSYIGWTLKHSVPNPTHYARDLIREPALVWVNGRYFTWVIAGLILPGVALMLWRGSAMAFLTGVVWGGLLRIMFWHHMIWYITSLAHVWGSREYLSRDRSTNSALLALFTLGESWHNNHHAFPKAAILRFKWYQFDISGVVVQLLQILGLASNVNRPSSVELAKKDLRIGSAIASSD